VLDNIGCVISISPVNNISFHELDALHGVKERRDKAMGENIINHSSARQYCADNTAETRAAVHL